MRLRINFGFIDSKEVAWWKPLNEFPTVIRFLGRNYEWAVYDKDLTGKVDMILMFSEIPSYDPNFGVECDKWSDMFPENLDGCECGAKHSSFPWDHMFMCKKWSKW